MFREGSKVIGQSLNQTHEGLSDIFIYLSCGLMPKLEGNKVEFIQRQKPRVTFFAIIFFKSENVVQF